MWFYIFLDYFKNIYIISLLIHDGVNEIFYEDFFEKKHLENIQNLYISGLIVGSFSYKILKPKNVTILKK